MHAEITDDQLLRYARHIILDEVGLRRNDKNPPVGQEPPYLSEEMLLLRNRSCRIIGPVNKKQ